MNLQFTINLWTRILYSVSIAYKCCIILNSMLAPPSLMKGRLSIVLAAVMTTATLLGVMVTDSNSLAQQGPIADDTEEHDRNQARLMDRTIHPNVTSSGSQQSIMPSPSNQSASPVSTTNATLSAKTNEQFYITLSSNPSTGYEWQVASVSNPDMVRFVDSQYIRPESELVGAPGKQVLTFNALQEGNAIVKLQYVRPWETGVPPVSIYVAEVMVVENAIQLQ
jgi:inhibitor of cysteine peptidase